MKVKGRILVMLITVLLSLAVVIPAQASSGAFELPPTEPDNFEACEPTAWNILSEVLSEQPSNEPLLSIPEP